MAAKNNVKENDPEKAVIKEPLCDDLAGDACASRIFPYTKGGEYRTYSFAVKKMGRGKSLIFVAYTALLSFFLPDNIFLRT